MTGGTQRGAGRLVVASVAAGGALGALLRWGLADALNAAAEPACPPAALCDLLWQHFPLGTLTVNVTGALLLGWLTARWPGPLARGFWGTGVLGAFTTYSAFAVESARMLQQQRPLEASAYVGVTLLVGLLAARVGLRWGGA